MSVGHTANAVQLTQTSLSNIGKQFGLILPGVKLAIPQQAPDTIEFIQQHTDQRNITHIRMQQYYKGFLVMGGYAIIHSHHTANSLLATQKDVQMNGTLYRGLHEELGNAPIDFTKNAAAALAQHKAQFAAYDVSEEQVTPLIFIDKSQTAHWAYKVSVLVDYPDRIPARPIAILDAISHNVLVHWDDIKTFTNKVNAIGFGGNEKIGQITYGKDFPYLNIRRVKLTETCVMENEAVRVIDMKHARISLGDAMKFPCPEDVNNPNIYWTGYQNDGYDLSNGGFSPTNDAMHFGMVIKKLYQDWYKVEALVKRTGTPMQLIMRVHYYKGYENAFWDGRRMTFGDGGAGFYPLVSLDISAHEVSHGFTGQHANLEYFGETGGINESFSDMAGVAAEYYSTGEINWAIGTKVIKEGSGREAMRYMDLPSRDGKSINSADEYHDGLNVHYSSGVFNHLFYLLATQPGWDVRKTFGVMIKANMDYWSPYSSFTDAGCGVLFAAKDLGYSLAAVQEALQLVAINYNVCGLA